MRDLPGPEPAGKSFVHRQNKPLSEVVREAVDHWLGHRARSERVRRCLESLGRFHSGKSDIAEQHDAYLDEAFGGSSEV